jgi:protein-tyrosine-phosphatase
VPPDNPAPSTRDTRPSVLFTCIHNAGRSVAAEVLAEHYADGVVAVTSAGSEPEHEPAIA